MSIKGTFELLVAPFFVLAFLIAAPIMIVLSPILLPVMLYQWVQDKKKEKEEKEKKATQDN